jgi:hypothetical protein
MSLTAHLDILKGSLVKRKELVGFLEGGRKHRLQNIINRNEINIEHLQKKIDYKHFKKERRKKIPGGFTRFVVDNKKQHEIESLQMQVINYFDDGTVPWG